MEVLIRADGNNEIGLGHLVRCSALASILRGEFNITFFCNTIPERLKTEFTQKGFNIIIIENESEFLNYLKENNIVILDGYHFSTDYQKKIKATGSRLVCIDDLHNKEFFADLIISHSPGLTPSDYKAQSYTRFALGLDYALLRPAFLKQASKHRKIDKIETILICFGGADPLNITEKTLENIIKINYFKKIIVVTGFEYFVTNDFYQLISKDKRIDHRNSLNEEQMLAVMKESDIAITQASGIILEIFSVGMPVITGYYVLDQMKFAINISQLNLAINIGDFRYDYNSLLTDILRSMTLEKANQLVINQKLLLKDSKKKVNDLFKFI